MADHTGHTFKMKHYNAPTNCYHCHEPLKLYNQNNEGLTCSSTCFFFVVVFFVFCFIVVVVLVFLTTDYLCSLMLLACHFVCHKQCQASVNLNCDQSLESRLVGGTFFKTQDEHERRRWVIQLQRLRNNVILKS